MYGKIFESIYDGSLYGEFEAIVVMKAMIVLADEKGIVDLSPQALAGRTSYPIDVVKKGLAVLQKPDPDSRSGVADGRRIVPLEDGRAFGWAIVNYEHYRALANRKEKREADRDRLSKKRGKTGDSASLSQSVAKCRKVSHDVANVAHTDTDTDTRKENAAHSLSKIGDGGRIEPNDSRHTAKAAQAARASRSRGRAASESRSASSSLGEPSGPKAKPLGFRDFWDVVHRREGKQAAKKAWGRAVDIVRQEHDWPQRKAVEYLVKRMKVFAASPQAQDDVKGTLHPATWLNQGRYDDADEVWQCGRVGGKEITVEDVEATRRRESLQKRREAIHARNTR